MISKHDIKYERELLYFQICFFLDFYIKFISKPYHENRNKILYRSVVLMSEIDMKSLEL